MRDKLDRNKLVEIAEDAIHDCNEMGESTYREYGIVAATLAQACATLALVKLLEESVCAAEIKALR